MLAGSWKASVTSSLEDILTKLQLANTSLEFMAPMQTLIYEACSNNVVPTCMHNFASLIYYYTIIVVIINSNSNSNCDNVDSQVV
jgi:hypothetical protein